MNFNLIYSAEANVILDDLEATNDAKAKKVFKALGLMAINSRHSSLNTHKYSSLSGPNKEEVFESYVENNTPGAYRIFWYYGPNRGDITILAVMPHP